jgi:hypothetical protein
MSVNRRTALAMTSNRWPKGSRRSPRPGPHALEGHVVPKVSKARSRVRVGGQADSGALGELVHESSEEMCGAGKVLGPPLLDNEAW